jgi:hypothetical protein
MIAAAPVSNYGASMSLSKPIDFVLRTAWFATLLAVLAVAAISAALAEPRADVAAVQTVEVEGTLFKITLTDGRVLRSSDLIGSNLLIGEPDRLLRVRLDAIEQDPDDKRTEVADADRIWLHSLSLEAPDRSWEPLC